MSTASLDFTDVFCLSPYEECVRCLEQCAEYLDQVASIYLPMCCQFEVEKAEVPLGRFCVSGCPPPESCAAYLNGDSQLSVDCGW